LLKENRTNALYVVTLPDTQFIQYSHFLKNILILIYLSTAIG